jgi:hypothetical protein
MRSVYPVLFILFSMSLVQAKEYTHKEYFEHYEGTQTCLECHRESAEQFFDSQHYQWQGLAPHIVNSGGQRLGKMNTINDFCTNPKANWIGLTRNSRGEVLAKGCSACHAGLGKLPQTEVSQEQLLNIDCLICHASGYRRDLYGSAEEGWEWKPILWKNRVGLDSVSKRISLPERTMCLRCHANSGGGPNFKRGDIEYEMRDCDTDLDVHMASSGLNMQCIACHAGEDHRVRGRGTDLSGFDMPDKPLACDTGECHSPQPHHQKVLNHHAERVYCPVCHIPEFAKVNPTDMVRDWSTPVYKADADKHSANITLEKNVKPVVTWYNGDVWEQLPGKKAQRLPTGEVGIMVPQGSRDDPNSRLYAFKLHRGRLPILANEQWIVPIVVEEFFADGDIDKAVRNAAKEAYEMDDIEYDWVDTVRYMGIFHEVALAKNALGCLDCHSDGGRIDWLSLGYEGDPLLSVIAAD